MATNGDADISDEKRMLLIKIRGLKDMLGPAGTRIPMPTFKDDTVETMRMVHDELQRLIGAQPAHDIADSFRDMNLNPPPAAPTLPQMPPSSYLVESFGDPTIRVHDECMVGSCCHYVQVGDAHGPMLGQAIRALLLCHGRAVPSHFAQNPSVA